MLQQLSITDSKVKWPLHSASARYTVLQTKNSRKSPLQSIQSPPKTWMIHVPQLPITDSNVKWPLRFDLTPVIQCYHEEQC